mmetsp:Transcript_11584/g.22045  ORF Transcript_11584/g.22045 Transcript_11584/m.22045 type:complete len:279 (-) Transcript_11584:93-929(-)|eukprot:CAMPEP_0197443632 /NCGR_PEP_ID=MMETSP1175-20131217/9331_1 /TAXON_ID=1003142 /ORGANISM="Triceratium dubium, Strain CCMP147" /LENGTH=278 /DNA_ID=CAMNT_0042974295 /DNA_START=175 /DNA_END=1011 /DNA_ORIENTATION=-
MKRGACIASVLAALVALVLIVTLPIVLTRNSQSGDAGNESAVSSQDESVLQSTPLPTRAQQKSPAPTNAPVSPPVVLSFTLTSPPATDSPTTPDAPFAPTDAPMKGRPRPGFDDLIAAAPPLAEPDESGEGCERMYGCRKDWGGDRMGHDAAFRPGEAVCSRQGAQYMFGLDENGRLLWADCTTSEERVYYDPDDDADVAIFVMRDDASFEIYNEDGQIVWQADCECKDEVMFYSQCLPSQGLDCPYIHLRKGSKAMLNYINWDYSWITADVHKNYNF